MGSEMCIRDRKKAAALAAAMAEEEGEMADDDSEEAEDAEAEADVAEAAEEAAPADEDASDDGADYDSMTVAELKELLKAAGKPVSGKKADLIARLNE